MNTPPAKLVKTHCDWDCDMMDWPTKADMEMGNHGHGRGTYSRPKNVRTKNSNKGAKNENRWYRTSSALPLPLSLIVNVIIATV